MFLINIVILSGTYKGFDDAGLLLLEISINNSINLLKINISKILKKRFLEYINNNTKIAVKGTVSLNKNNEVVIVANKIFFLDAN